VRHWYFLFRATATLLMAYCRAALTFSGQLPENLSAGLNRRRIKHYYYGTTFLGVIFSVFAGHGQSVAERRRFNTLSVLACYFDDLTDRVRDHSMADSPHGHGPEDYGKTHDRGGPSVGLLRQVAGDLSPASLSGFETHLQGVFDIEKHNRQARGELLEEAVLTQITREKGGHSVLLFRAVIYKPPSAAEQRALLEFGALIQLCDDIFDVWFDQQQGVQTLPVLWLRKLGADGLTAHFERQVEQARLAFQGAANCSMGRSAIAWGCVWFLIATTRVCLSHYRDLQKNNGTLPFADRNAMVVDMERTFNRIRTLRYLLSPN
jgi:hypothetical protein